MINQQVKMIEDRETIDVHAVGLGKGGERAWWPVVRHIDKQTRHPQPDTVNDQTSQSQ